MKNVLIIGAIIGLLIIIMKSVKPGKITSSNAVLTPDGPVPNKTGVKLGTEVNATTTDLTNAIARGFKAPANTTGVSGRGSYDQSFEINPLIRICPNCSR